MFTSNKCYVKNVDADSHASKEYMYGDESPQDCDLIFTMSDGTGIYCKISDEDKVMLKNNLFRFKGALYIFLLD